MSQTEVERNEISNTERLGHFAVAVSLIVKARDQQDASNFVAIEMNRWFTKVMGIAPYPRGTLLHWRYVEDREIM